LSYKKLWQDVKDHRRLYLVGLPLVFVLAAFIALCKPNFYTCTVKLAPELSGAKSGGSLANLASSFGVNLGGASSTGDALVPTLYPDLMNSAAFMSSLFAIPVTFEEDDSMKTVTYYEYLLDHQRAPWWSTARAAFFKSIASLFTDKEEEKVTTVDPFHLTNEQAAIVEALKKNVICDVDKKTMVITIDVVDQDAIVAATLADSVQNRLQKFITDYRTRKARIDLEYNRKLLVEAEQRYDKARQDYSAYSDANRKSLFENKNTERQKYETKLQIESRAYSQVAAQLQLAEAKVQEETPAFTMLQPPSVPVKKTGPKRAVFCLVWLFLATIGITLYIFHKSGDLSLLLSLFSGDDDDDPSGNPPSLILDNSEYILVPKSSLHQDKSPIHDWFDDMSK
jgi:hypothetical protein